MENPKNLRHNNDKNAYGSRKSALCLWLFHENVVILQFEIRYRKS
jgi:hypothetical protein